MEKWAAIDFETANASRDSACSLGIALVDEGHITSSWYRLIRPPTLEFDPFNVMIHNITSDMVKNEPTLGDMWEAIQKILAGRTLLAHSAAFDLSVLRHTLDAFELPYPTLDYACTVAISRRSWPGLYSYSLPVIANYLGIKFQHHNAKEDALACARIALLAVQQHSATSLADLSERIAFQMGRLFPGYVGWRASARDIAATTTDFDPENELYGKRVVFTGSLQKHTRREALQAVADSGGIPEDRVTRKTNLLVVGELDYRKLIDGETSSKLRRARDYSEKGRPLEIISEDDFLRMLSQR